MTAAREEWRSLAKRLADELAAAGGLGPAWRAAFAAVPRHVFVPRFLRNDGSTVDGADPADRAEWLAQVYATPRWSLSSSRSPART